MEIFIILMIQLTHTVSVFWIFYVTPTERFVGKPNQVKLYKELSKIGLVFLAVLSFVSLLAFISTRDLLLMPAVLQLVYLATMSYFKRGDEFATQVARTPTLYVLGLANFLTLVGSCFRIFA